MEALDQALAMPPAGQPWIAAALVLGLLDGRGRVQLSAGQSLPALPERFEAARRSLLESARKTAIDVAAPPGERLAAIRALRIGQSETAVPLLAGLVDPAQPQDIQLAAIATLARFDVSAVAETLLAAWPQLSPAVRAAAADALFSRPAWSAAVLEAIEAQKIAGSEIDPARLAVLQLHVDPAIRRRAAELTARLRGGARPEVVAEYRPVLELTGDAERGKATFQKTCATCHRLDNLGFDVGPSLASIRQRGPDAILLAVLDPNREVNPQYVNYVAVLEDGRTTSGMIAAESATSITLKRAEGASDTLPAHRHRNPPQHRPIDDARGFGKAALAADLGRPDCLPDAVALND